jgi:adenylate cyclase 10
MYGREEILRRITSIIDKFMKGIEKRSLVIVKGTFAIGKTLLARKVLYRIQEKINLN